jgi:heptosyltransferase-3
MGTRIQYPVSSIQYPASSIQNPLSSFQERAGTRPPALLVVHPGALGDVLAGISVLQLAKNRFPRLHVLCQEGIGKVLFRLHLADKTWATESAVFASLYGNPSEAAARFLNDHQAVLLLSMSPDLKRAVQSVYSGPLHQISPQPPPSCRVHVADHLLSELRQIGLLEPGRQEAPARDLRRLNADPARILIHPGSGSRKKMWPFPHFLEVAHRLSEEGLQVEFLLGPAESYLKAVVESSGIPILLTDDLMVVLDRLLEAGALIGNDSGISHLSALVGVPTVAVFGPTDPSRWAPRGRSVAIVSAEDKELSLERVRSETVLDAFFQLTGRSR